MTLKTLRTRAKLSMAEMAEKLDTDRTLIWRWENGSRTPGSRRIFDIAKVLGVSPEKVLLALPVAQRQQAQSN